MKHIKRDDINRWYVEIQQAEKFRDDQFGKYTDSEIRGVGENLQYVDYGVSWNTLRDSGGLEAKPSSIGSQPFTTLNIIFPIVKNIIPSLYFRNPKVMCFPKRKIDEDTTQYAAEILNYYGKELNQKEQVQLSIFDAYVLGMGVMKIGYSTKFGPDIEDKGLEKRREKGKERSLLEKIGLRKPKEEEKVENVDINQLIKSESPYVIWVSPFDFLIDPRAKSIDEASWVAHRVKKTLRDVKSNPQYSNTENLQPSALEKTPQQYDISDTQIDNFQTIDIYEIHYKTPDKINILTLAKDQVGMKALRHEESVYDIDGFQFEVLTFNKHGHKLYPRPDISIIKGLQDRVTNTFDSILDQVDRFVTKVLVDRNKLEKGGENALEDGELGSIVYCNGDVNTVAKELSMTQVKADLSILIDKIIDVMSLEVGLTRAQLTGLTTAGTATEAQIGQAGQNLRRSDQAETVVEFVIRVNQKLWQVINQFVDLEELQLITGEPKVSSEGKVTYSWLDIDPGIREKLNKGKYSIDIEVGSAQRPNIEIIRQQAFNLIRDLFNPVIEQTLSQEGSHLNHTELLRMGFKLMPEFIKTPERVLQQASMGQQQLQALMQAMQSGAMKPSENGKSLVNAQGNRPQSPPTPTTMQEEVMGEQMGGFQGGGV